MCRLMGYNHGQMYTCIATVDACTFSKSLTTQGKRVRDSSVAPDEIGGHWIRTNETKRIEESTGRA
jgi:hypothetical protein